CRIGPGCLLAAQVGLAGSTVLGARVMLGGQVGSAGHLAIGEGAQVAAQSGLHRDIPAGAQYGGYPAVEVSVWRRITAALPRLPAGLNVDVTHSRAGLELFFQGTLHAQVIGSCARCLEEYAFDLDHPFAFVLMPRAAADAHAAALSAEDMALSHYEGDQVDL